MGERTGVLRRRVTVQADATTNTLLISAPEPLYRNLAKSSTCSTSAAPRW